MGTANTDRHVLYKLVLSQIIESKRGLYGYAFINKLSRRRHLALSPQGEVVSLHGDFAEAIADVLSVVKDIHGKAGVESACRTLRTLGNDYAIVADDIENAIADFC